jgi:DNA mismatch repair protein MutS2
MDTLEALEFDRILEVLSGFSHSVAARLCVLEIRPLRSAEDIRERFGLVGEIRRLSQEGASLGFARYEDIGGVIESVRPEGAVLEPRELLLLVPVLGIMSRIARLLEGREDAPRLRDYTFGLTGFPELLASIERTVDGEGNILDSASYELSDLRARRRAMERRITRRLEAMVRDREVAPFIQDDFITRRSGRWVIPVRMDSKGEVPGVVHDVSRSGETAFVEPLEIIGLANGLENLVAEEKAEVIRILKGVCREIRAVAWELEWQFGTVLALDVLSSIAGFAEWLGLEEPVINGSSMIRLQGARHPLLLLIKDEAAAVVPLDLSLGGEERVMVITGPNAGGKTIAIKTVGLLTLMALSGIPVSAASSSTFPVLSELLVDIGDEQSIQESLSTFSAHVSNISGMLRRAGPKTLLLMDELGTGTDPAEGAAIGCAVLRDLMQKGASAIATTHLVDIVGFVHREEGMVNASMEFARDTFAPLYRLRKGEPGQSHAIETARKYGLPEETIHYARSLLGTMKAEFHGLLAEIREKRMRYEEALTEVEREKEEMKGKRKVLDEELAALEAEKRGVLKGAYEEAREVVRGIRKQAYEALEEARRERRRGAPLERLSRVREEIEEKLDGFRTEPPLPIEGIAAGDVVFVRSVGYDAEVLEVHRGRKRLRVNVGGKELQVPASDVGPRKGKAPEQRVRRDPDFHEDAPLVLNLIGLRVDESLMRLEPFLNHASMAGAGEVAVVHGLGTGALLKAVREYVGGHPLVSGFRSGEPTEGGEGVTILRLG